ncbi:hypothetical protein [Streptomyces sp. NPDC029041]|uniref:hypothetical protein n=1 Tax=Streptomyces sp. NPDC029041 TaxID=3155727 RepID=UPI0033CC2759
MEVEEELWLGIDREKLRAKCADLASTRSGLLAVHGDDSMGIIEAARIAIAIFKNMGWQTHHVPDAGANGLSTFRFLLEHVSQWAMDQSAAPTRGLSVRASSVSLSLERFTELTTELLRPLAKSPGLAVIVTAFGRSDAPSRLDLEGLAKLAHAVGGCWVVMGHSGKSWQAFSSDAALELRRFTKHEVAASLRAIVRERGGNPAGVDQYMQKFGLDDEKVIPMLAYAHLKLLTHVPLQNHGELL